MALPKQRSSSSSSFTRMLLGRDRLPTPWVHPRPSRMTQPGVGRSSAPRSATRGLVGLTELCVEAALKIRRTWLGPKVLEGPLLGYKRVQGGFEETSVGKEAAKEESDVLNKLCKVPTASPAPS
jgi:hypothetical protein